MTNTEYLLRYELLPPGSHVLCALSGGRDSVYLLYRLMEWSREYGLKISAAHYNHRLRGDESDRDEAFVRQLCQRLEIPLFVGDGDVRAYAEENKLGIEEAARTLRYAFLDQACRQAKADVVATAHHADDLAETMLLNLVRGAGTKGLGGIPPRRGNIVRPILTVTRREIDAYLQQHRIAYVEDSTNAADDCNRNVLRHHVMPLLEQLNPAFVANAVHGALLLRADEAYLQECAQTFLEANPVEQGIDGQRLLALGEPVASRVLRNVWGGGLHFDHVREILSLCTRQGVAYVHVPDGVVRWDGGRLWVDTPLEIPADQRLEGERGTLQFGEFTVCWERGVCEKEVHNSFNTFVLKCENINGAIMVTTRRDGDRVKLSGRGHTKKLKHLFQEKQMIQPQRATTPVFRDESGIVAVFGFGIAQRCVAKIGDQIITLRVTKKQRNGG